jgi:hypothetical protein
VEYRLIVMGFFLQLTAKVPELMCQDYCMLMVNKKQYPDRPSANQCSEHLWSLLLRCWAYEPSERPTIDTVVEQYRRISAQ